MCANQTGLNGPSSGVRLGLHVPSGLALSLSAGQVRAACSALGVDLVELHATVVEAFLDAPVPTVALEPPAVDGIELGLLELEEEVLQDSYELAKHTFDTQLRQWRESVPLAPLATWRRDWDAAGIVIHAVQWDGLAGWSDDEVDYAGRVSNRIGARVLATDLPRAGIGRLAGLAEPHALKLGVLNSAATRESAFVRALKEAPGVGAALDVEQWMVDGHQSPLSFIAAHADRLTHVRLTVRSTHAGGPPFGDASPLVADLLQQQRKGGHDVPVILAVDAESWDGEQMQTIREALAFCRRTLAG